MKAATAEWDKYQNAKHALAGVNETSFNSVINKILPQKVELLAAAKNLQSFADKHCKSAGVPASNFTELTNQEVDNALLKQAASILGVESNESTKPGLALFAGPFAKNESIWIKTLNHLAFQQLDKNNELRFLSF